MSDEQRWARERIVEWSLGELSEADEERFRRVIKSDPEFAELVELRDSGDRGHVPAAMIARWEAAGLKLRGQERALVLAHVRGCSQCQEDVELVGGEVDSWMPSVARPARGWAPWFGGMAIGAAAALVFMFAWPADEGLNGTNLPVMTPQTLRSADPVAYPVAVDAKAFLLATPLPTDIPSGADVVLRVLDPSGRVMSETRLDPPPWSPPTAQVLVVDDSGLAAGEYTVELATEEGPRDLGRFRIEIER